MERAYYYEQHIHVLIDQAPWNDTTSLTTYTMHTCVSDSETDIYNCVIVMMHIKDTARDVNSLEMPTPTSVL